MNRKIRNIICQSFLPFLVLLLFSVSDSKADRSSANEFNPKIPKTLNNIVITGEKVELVLTWKNPEIADKEFQKNWNHVSRETSGKNLAGHPGEVIIDVFQNAGIEITREFWLSDDKQEIAIRQKITNLSKDGVRLKKLFPFYLAGKDGLVFKEEKKASNWDVLIQQRLKNDQPRAISPAGNDIILIDPFVVFHANEITTPDLLIGYLSQTDHLADFSLAFEGNTGKADFSSLTADCEFDNVTMPAGGERVSQWVYLKSGFDTNELIAWYADRVGEYYGVSKPIGRAPSVFCTWYFHGKKYNEALFEDDLASLKKDNMPFDVFLIDDCWANGDWGYWRPNSGFPNGMRKITNEIREAGYSPGIWTAPYLVEMNSELAKEHPEWLLKTNNDSLLIFGYDTKAWILDPTYPGVIAHIEEVFRRLKNDYGFSYFKLDFMRAVFVFDNAKFYDPHVTRLEAYRMGLEAVRRGVGQDSYISVCGGHFGGSIGIANSQRSGSDVVSLWEPKQVFAFRQNIMRTWMSRLWHVDPDALMIRKRSESYYGPDMVHAKLSLGKLTDNEALTFTLNQYVGGGMVCFSEFLSELQPERKDLYKHIIPSINTPSEPIDIFNNFIPGLMLTKVTPVCRELQNWNTIALMNFGEKDMSGSVALSGKAIESLKTSEYIISEFFSDKVLGVFAKGDTVDLGLIPPHQSRLLRIAPWNGNTPVLAGTDLHFSGGGVEIEKWEITADGSVTGQINSDWHKPVKIRAAFPAKEDNGYVLKEIFVSPSQKKFFIYE